MYKNLGSDIISELICLFREPHHILSFNVSIQLNIRKEILI